MRKCVNCGNRIDHDSKIDVLCLPCLREENYAAWKWSAIGAVMESAMQQRWALGECIMGPEEPWKIVLEKEKHDPVIVQIGRTTDGMDAEAMKLSYEDASDRSRLYQVDNKLRGK